MALFAIAFLGTTPLGAPLVGWIGEHFGPRAGFAFGAVAAIVAATVALVLLPRLGRREPQTAEVRRPAVPPVAVGETPASA
jgi:predicted MFS family arabinose efflux permease